MDAINNLNDIVNAQQEFVKKTRKVALENIQSIENPKLRRELESFFWKADNMNNINPQKLIEDLQKIINSNADNS